MKTITPVLGGAALFAALAIPQFAHANLLTNGGLKSLPENSRPTRDSCTPTE